jgi:transposase
MPLSLAARAARQAQAANLYARGDSGPQIAAQLGCSFGTVYLDLHRLGVPRRRPGPQGHRAFPPARKALADAAADLYRSGLSLRQIAAQQERSYVTVRLDLCHLGVSLRPSGGAARKLTPRQALAAKTAAFYRAGKTVREIAQEQGRSIGTVWSDLHEQGVKLRGRVRRRRPA